MPEGDTVWRQARDLHAALAGRPLTASDFRVPAFATLDLTGQRVDSVQSRGKHLLMNVGDVVIHSHLLMEGHWDIYGVAQGAPLPKLRRPAHTIRAILRNESAAAIGFSLGILEVLPVQQAQQALSHLGPDLLGPDWNIEEATARILATPDRPIGLALLDQNKLAGIGNIYRNELCFLGGVHPETPSAQVHTLPRILELAKRLLEANKDRPQRSTTGGPARRANSLWVYRLAGSPCKRCGVLIREATLADPEHPERAARSIYFCPRCQPLPN